MAKLQKQQSEGKKSGTLHSDSPKVFKYTQAKLYCPSVNTLILKN